MPMDLPYHHHEYHDDGNGGSHVRATLMGPSVALPVSEGAAMLGIYQQIVFIDLDNRPRRRRVIVQIVGE